MKMNKEFEEIASGNNTTSSDSLAANIDINLGKLPQKEKGSLLVHFLIQSLYLIAIK